jgi:tetratricopeptide (TPR) repeat protein
LILPDFVAAYAGRGLTYEKKGDLVKAKADFEKALALSPDLDAGLARPAQAEARAELPKLAKLTADEVARAKAAAEAEAKAARTKAAAETEAKALRQGRG